MEHRIHREESIETRYHQKSIATQIKQIIKLFIKIAKEFTSEAFKIRFAVGITQEIEEGVHIHNLHVDERFSLFVSSIKFAKGRGKRHRNRNKKILHKEEIVERRVGLGMMIRRVNIEIEIIGEGLSQFCAENSSISRNERSSNLHTGHR